MALQCVALLAVEACLSIRVLKRTTQTITVLTITVLTITVLTITVLTCPKMLKIHRRSSSQHRWAQVAYFCSEMIPY